MNKKLIPSIITLSNLIFGITSLYFTMQGLYREATAAVLFAALLDGMDGRLARRLKVASDFGKELDSLADLVSFGVAPALLAFGRVLHHLGYWGLAVSVVFALCGAIRLARFNVLNIKTHFVGVPITFCGPLLVVLLLLVDRLPVVFYPLATLLLSYLMVSQVKVPKY